MGVPFIIAMFRRLGTKSPKFFKIIQWLSFGTAIVAGAFLLLSEYELISLYNQDKWDELFKALFYSGLGSGGTASTSTTNPELVSDEVKTNILQDKKLY